MSATDVYYCGCLHSIGHFTYRNGRERQHGHAVGPWRSLDSDQLSSKRHGTGVAWLHHLDGWTALGISDRTVDSRPNSRSVFAIHAADLTADEVLEAARVHYAHVLDRISPITLVRAPGDGGA